MVLAHLIALILAADSVALAICVERFLEKILSPELLILGWAFSEEVIKLAVVLIVALLFSVPKKKWEKIGFSSAIGFSVLESSLYIIEAFKINGDFEMYTTLVSRLLLSTPVHIISTFFAVFGFSKNWKTGLAFMFLATAFHTLFNAYLTSREILPEGFKIGYVLFLFVFISIFTVYKFFIVLRNYWHKIGSIN